MFCPNCGKELDEGAAFCKECGTKLNYASPAANGATPTAQPLQTSIPSMQPQAAAFNVGQPQPLQTAPQMVAARSRDIRKRAVVIVVSAAALVAAIVAVFLIYQNAQQQAAEQVAYAQAHTEHAVVFKVDAAGYSDATASKIPVHVTGSDQDGAAIDEDAYIDSEGAGLELMQGMYTVIVVTSPLSSDGTIYDVPADTWNITIGDDVEPDAPIDAAAQPITLAPISDYTSVDDELVQRIYDYASRSGADQGTIDNYRNVTASRIQAAKDQKAADDAAAADEARRQAEEAQRLAEEKEAAEAAAELHYENEYFSCDLPEVVRGKWRCELKTSGSTLDFWFIDSSVTAGPSSYCKVEGVPTRRSGGDYLGSSGGYYFYMVSDDEGSYSGPVDEVTECIENSIAFK